VFISKHSEKGTIVRSMQTKKMSVPLHHSYKCKSHETDILMDHTKKLFVRITGVKLQAFDIVKDGKYSKGNWQSYIA